MQQTEKLLGDVSLQCNPDIIDKKARHLTGLQEQTAQQSSCSVPCRLLVVIADVPLGQNQAVVI